MNKKTCAILCVEQTNNQKKKSQFLAFSYVSETMLNLHTPCEHPRMSFARHFYINSAVRPVRYFQIWISPSCPSRHYELCFSLRPLPTSVFNVQTFYGFFSLANVRWAFLCSHSFHFASLPLRFPFALLLFNTFFSLFPHSLLSFLPLFSARLPERLAFIRNPL